MIQNGEKSNVRGFGKLPLIAAIRLVTGAAADPTVVHSAGIETAARASAGVINLTLSNDVLDVLQSGFPFAVLCVHSDVIAANGATVNYRVQTISVNEATGVIQIALLSGNFAGPAALALNDAGSITITTLVYALEA